MFPWEKYSFYLWW